MNIGPTEAIDQHYVPRFYLKRFADGRGRLPALDLSTGRAFLSAPGRAAKKQGFNDFDIESIRVSTESWLGGLEADAAPLIARLVENPASLTSLSVDEERVLARFIAAQRLRVPSQRDFLDNTRERLVTHIKEMARAHLHHTLESQQAEEVWADWAVRPDEWWLQADEPIQAAETVAYLLSGLEGLSNLFRALPWRIGQTDGVIYTSDNPVSAFAYSTFPFGDMRPIYDYIYYIPLSPNVLLRLGPPDSPPNPDGPRERRDFNSWETSIARHVVTDDARNLLFGEPPWVDRTCAAGCLSRLNNAKRHDAVRLQSFDPTPPYRRPLPPEIRAYGKADTPPDVRGLYETLFDFVNHEVPLSALSWWLPEFAYTASHSLTTPKRQRLISDFIHAAYGPDSSGSAVQAAAGRLVLELFPGAFYQYMKDRGSTIGDILGTEREAAAS
jgi:hypothetical protein